MCRAAFCCCSVGGQLPHQDSWAEAAAAKCVHVCSPHEMRSWAHTRKWQPCGPSCPSLPAAYLTPPNSRVELDYACLLG